MSEMAVSISASIRRFVWNNILITSLSKNARNENQIQDWNLLVELMLDKQQRI